MQDNLNQGIETKIIDTPNSSFNNELLNKNNLQEKEFWDNIVVQIKQELIVEGYSSKTIKMYLIYISDFFKYIKKEIKDLTKNDILAFLAYKKETGCDNATLSLIHAASLKYLFKKIKFFCLKILKFQKSKNSSKGFN